MSTKTVYRVAVIGGDGIGPEVLREVEIMKPVLQFWKIGRRYSCENDK